MAIDSTAELLFNITANADDATENIAKFRALMGKDLSDLGAEFEDWSDEVLGEITTVQGAVTAGFAAMAAGLVAVTAVIHESSAEYTKYTDEVSAAMIKTGASAEDMSVLHEAAAQSGVGFETLTNGLVKFEQAIAKGSTGSNAQSKAFAALGISQTEVVAGQKDMLPLLMKVMDGFHNTASATQRASLAKDLFTRSGPELLSFLTRGSEWLKTMGEEADRLGIKLNTQSIAAAREFTQAQRILAAETEAVNIQIGNQTQGLRTWWGTFEATTVKFLTDKKYFGEFSKAWKSTVDEITESVKSLKTNMVVDGNKPLIPPAVDGPKIKEAKNEWEGISTIVESLNAKVAEGEGPWEKLAIEAGHYRFEVSKAKDELNKLKTAGTITAEAFARESAALSGIPGLIAKIIAETSAKIRAEETKAWGEAVEKSIEESDREQEELERAGEARVQVTREINDKLATQDEQGYAAQAARWQGQQEAWAAGLVKKAALTLADWAKIDQITMDGLLKIGQAEQTAWQEEQSKMRAHLESLIADNSTEQQKIYAEYQKSLLELQAAEESALKKVEGDQAKTYQVRQMYAQLTTQLIQQYQNDLNKLLNSQGWQGVFGSKFAADIQKNQQLAKQWATSTNQSLMMVQVTMENLREQAQKTFESMAQGMATSIVNAIVMGKSVEQAMQQVLASTLESIAGQAAVQAIYAAGLGFLDLAEGDAPGAAAAFTSAAIFGGIAAAAAITGMALTPSSSSAGGSGGGGGSSSSGSRPGNGAAAGAAAGAGQSPQQGNVTINIQGPVVGASGISQLTDMINQAVYGNDVTLYASHNPQGVPL